MVRDMYVDGEIARVYIVLVYERWEVVRLRVKARNREIEEGLRILFCLLNTLLVLLLSKLLSLLPC